MGSSIRSLLVANRGEIACRIMRTCRAWGIRTVAVHSAADGDSRHVRHADEAVEIDAGRPVSTYLDIDRLIAAAKQEGCDAVHPGYGFLSESPEFARRVEDAGLIFIGPSAATIALMGDKIAARKVASNAGVVVLPGTPGPITPDEARTSPGLLEGIGYPAMIKAAGGGGGIGMTRADDPQQLQESLERASGLGERVFGDNRVYAERLLTSPRHVEVQVFGDGRGLAWVVGDRDCSLQRRHQKVIEEAPAPAIPSGTRDQLHQAAEALTSHISYEGAGTVEFLVEDGEVYFLEMNTRLQVEHPVTELVEDIDLVAWQLQLAGGEGRPWEVHDPGPRGHAIECRIYAERPDTFLPAPGTIRHLEWPDDPWVRVDTGYDAGDEVTTAFDPLVAKLVILGGDREQALGRMLDALDRVNIGGLVTNVPALRAAIASPQFGAAELTTTLFEKLIAGEE